MGGLFITFEGPDGSGKTTQLKRLGNRLKAKGIDVVLTREPGGTPISDAIREMILSPEHVEMGDKTEVLLYAASRAQHVHQVILPALRRGAVVICDRYIDASLAYQGYGLGQRLEEIQAISHYASSGLQPHRTYLLDVSVEVSRQRMQQRAAGADAQELDRIELKGTQYHERVRNGFMRIAEQEPERVLRIDAARTEEQIAADINDDVDRLLQRTISRREC